MRELVHDLNAQNVFLVRSCQLRYYRGYTGLGGKSGFSNWLKLSERNALIEYPGQLDWQCSCYLYLDHTTGAKTVQLHNS